MTVVTADMNHFTAPGRFERIVSVEMFEHMRNYEALLGRILAATYGEARTLCWWVRWRVFFMACSELFACYDGDEWFVAHYAFAPR